MTRIETYLLAACLLALLASCTRSEDSAPSPAPDWKEMVLKISVPKSRSERQSPVVADRETHVETLDVVVFAKGKTDNEYYLAKAAQCTAIEGLDNAFSVVLPLGKALDIHFFANTRVELSAAAIYDTRGTLRESVLAGLTQSLSEVDLQDEATRLPMHGRLENITISDDSPAKSELAVGLLRSVATVCVATNATVDETAGTITPGEIADFSMRELYVYYPAAKGLIAPLPASMDTHPDGTPADNVKLPSLPDGIAGGTWWGTEDCYRPKVTSTTPVGIAEGLYFYENRAGHNLDDTHTRIVVGGFFGTDSKISYYLVNFWDANEVFHPVLRNHRYLFNIRRVSDTGYDTPDQAAKGKPINISVKTFEWKEDHTDIDYDDQTYFKLQSKTLQLPRMANSVRTLAVSSNCPAGEWSMSFADAHNGATTPALTPTTAETLENGRYRIVKTADRLTVTVLKSYDDVLTGDETRDDVLRIRVKNLTISINLAQLDQSPDDWGGGGEQDTDLGKDDQP